MKIKNKEFNFYKSVYGNTFFSFLPFINICIYKEFAVCSTGWLLFYYSFYIDLTK